MRTSHKLTQIFVVLATLVVLTMSAMAGDDPTNIGVSDQKAGSVLVFPYYISNAQNKYDTRLTLSNIGARNTAVHLFFLDSSCSQADTYVCLTPNASISLKASEVDPEVKGWLLAVAVDDMGVPTQANRLIGNAFVSEGAYVGNYGAEAFWKHSPGRDNVTFNDLKADTAILNFNGKCDVGGYDYIPCQFRFEIQSPIDAPGQKIVTVGLNGTVGGTVSGAGQSGVGQIYNGNEKPFGSFSGFLSGNCRAEATFSTTAPRVPLGLGNLIPSGNVGTVQINITAGVGLLMTSNAAPNKWSGIRTLHKTALAPASTLTIPVFMPGC